MEKDPTGSEQYTTYCTLPVIALQLRLCDHIMFLLLLSESTSDPADIRAKLKRGGNLTELCISTGMIPHTQKKSKIKLCILVF